MNEQIETQLRNWLKGNLVIDVQIVNKYGPGGTVKVGLRFKDEKEKFSEEIIYIPSVYRV